MDYYVQNVHVQCTYTADVYGLLCACTMYIHCRRVLTTMCMYNVHTLQTISFCRCLTFLFRLLSQVSSRIRRALRAKLSDKLRLFSPTRFRKTYFFFCFFFKCVFGRGSSIFFIYFASKIHRYILKDILKNLKYAQEDILQKCKKKAQLYRRNLKIRVFGVM